MQARKPGDVVFARVPTFPWWPAVIGRDPASGTWEDDGRVWVYFFGDATGAWAAPREIRPFTPAEKATTARLNGQIPKYRRYLGRIKGCCDLAQEFNESPDRPLAQYSTHLTVDGLVLDKESREHVFLKYCVRITRDELVHGEDAGNDALAEFIKGKEPASQEVNTDDSDLPPVPQTFGERLAARRAAERTPGATRRVAASPPPVERAPGPSSSSTGSGSGEPGLPRSVSLQSVENLNGAVAQSAAAKKRSKRKRVKSTRLNGFVNPLGSSPPAPVAMDDGDPRSIKRQAGLSAAGAPRPVKGATGHTNGRTPNPAAAARAGAAPTDDSPVTGDTHTAPRRPAWVSARRSRSATLDAASSVNGESSPPVDGPPVGPSAGPLPQVATPDGGAGGKIDGDEAAEHMRRAIESLAHSTEEFARSRGYDTGRIGRDIDALFPTPQSGSNPGPGNAYARSLARNFVWTAWKRRRRI